MAAPCASHPKRAAPTWAARAGDDLSALSVLPRGGAGVGGVCVGRAEQSVSWARVRCGQASQGDQERRPESGVHGQCEHRTTRVRTSRLHHCAAGSHAHERRPAATLHPPAGISSVAASLSEGRCDHRVAAEMHRTPLRQADALILPSLAPARTAEETKPLTRITAAIKAAVSNKGSVLIPGGYPRVLDRCEPPPTMHGTHLAWALLPLLPSASWRHVAATAGGGGCGAGPAGGRPARSIARWHG